MFNLYKYLIYNNIEKKQKNEEGAIIPIINKIITQKRKGR
jgi:hypothetical protein